MKTVKGQEGLSIEVLIGLVFSLIIALLVIVIVLPAIMSTEDAASCVGFLRGIGSIIADLTGVSIC